MIPILLPEGNRQLDVVLPLSELEDRTSRESNSAVQQTRQKKRFGFHSLSDRASALVSQHFLGGRDAT